MKNGLEFDTFRVLVIDPSTGDGTTGFGEFSGNDPNGEPLAGQIVEYRDPDHDQTGDFFVFHSDSTNIDGEVNQDQEVYDYEEGESWTNKPCKPTFAIGIIADRGVNQEGACIFAGGGLGFGTKVPPATYKLPLESKDVPKKL